MATLDFDADTHVYSVSGVRFPSVTQVLKDVGLIDTSQPWYTDWHRDRGAMAHRMLELHDTNELETNGLDEQLMPYLQGWRRFLEESQAEVVAVERRLHSLAYRYAGTIDRVLLFHEQPEVDVICDIKLGQPERWHAIQTAAYALLWTQGEKAPKAVKRCCVYLGDDARYRLDMHHCINDRQTWVACLHVYNFKHEKEKKTNEQRTERTGHQ